MRKTLASLDVGRWNRRNSERSFNCAWDVTMLVVMWIHPYLKLDTLLVLSSYPVCPCTLYTFWSSLYTIIVFIHFISVKGPPPPIEGIEFISSNPTSVQIRWRLPETTDLNEIENIIFGSGDEGTPFKKLSTVNLNERDTSYTLDGLQPDTRYTVMVVTENRYGNSKRVEITVETMPIRRKTILLWFYLCVSTVSITKCWRMKMWCDLGKSVRSRIYDIFSFH